MTSEMWNNLSQEDKDYYNNLMYVWFTKESMLEMKQDIKKIKKSIAFDYKSDLIFETRFTLMLGVFLGSGIGICLTLLILRIIERY